MKINGVEDLAYLAKLAAEISSRTATMPVFTEEMDPKPSKKASTPPKDVQIDEKGESHTDLTLLLLIGCKEVSDLGPCSKMADF